MSTTIFNVIFISIIALFFIVLITRALLFKPHKLPPVDDNPITVNRDRIIQNMVDLIRCKTVSYSDKSLMDMAEFKKLQNLIEERYPLVHSQCTREFIGDTGILFKWSGKDSSAPAICMAHYDVVPIDENSWTKPAFEGIIEDDKIWGRGTLDTKGTFCSILESAEQLLSEGFIPNQDIYLAFSGDEEIFGDSCPAMVDVLEERGIKPSIIIDEGGAVVENAFPGVTAECALVGIGEKGGVNIDLHLKSRGGHASTPPTPSALGVMANAIKKIEDNPISFEYTKPVLEMLDILGRYSNFGYRIMFANLWYFKPILAKICAINGNELNAMLRTTCAITRAEGSDAYNVIPTHVTVGANLRLLGKSTIENTVAHLKKSINNPNIEIEVVNGMNPSINSDTTCDEWKNLNQIIRQTWPNAIVSPYLMMACSDSRHYCRITDRVYRFSAMKLSKEERGMIHGTDERIPIDTLITAVEFYIRFMKSC